MRAFNSIRSNLRATTALIALPIVPIVSVEAGQGTAKSKGQTRAVDIMLMQPSATARAVVVSSDEKPGPAAANGGQAMRSPRSNPGSWQRIAPAVVVQ